MLSSWLNSAVAMSGTAKSLLFFISVSEASSGSSGHTLWEDCEYFSFLLSARAGSFFTIAGCLLSGSVAEGCSRLPIKVSTLTAVIATILNAVSGFNALDKFMVIDVEREIRAELISEV